VEYGDTPWGRRFVMTLEAYDEPGRLSRGKDYAELGKVTELRIAGCAATAKVAGHSRPWYRVSLRFKPLANNERERLLNIVGKDSPRDLVADIEAAGLDLIPQRWLDVVSRCTCPDWELRQGRRTPCKHQSAVWYRIAQAMDSDPLVLLALRGIERPTPSLSADFPPCALRFVIREKRARRAEPQADEAHRFTLALYYLPEPRWEEERPEAVPLSGAYASPGGYRALRYLAMIKAYLPELSHLTTRKSICLEKVRLEAFLSETGPILRRWGVEIVLPRRLRCELKPRAAIRVQAKGPKPLHACLGLTPLLDYDRGVAIGDRFLSVEEFEALLREKREVVLFRENFVRLDPLEAARLIKEAGSKVPLSVLDMLRSRLSGDAFFSVDAEELAASLFREQEVEVPSNLRATLRPYQVQGYRWAYSNLISGFGCVLADDMGLGKTIQAIAVMLRLRRDALARGGILVVGPAALLTNWERELSRFAPDLNIMRYHGKGRTLRDDVDLTLTTFATAAIDSRILCEREFALLVVDEAHILKNASTRQAKAMRGIRARYKLALSGTPVENKLEDMRSLFELILPGYLGSAADFGREFRVPIERNRDPAAAAKLKRITSPFLMRRLKTDLAIAPDLPEKVTMDEYATMARGQAALYESVVRKAMKDAGRAGPEEKLALILKLITSLKQICDHPRVYDKESPPKARLSGKAMLLVELLRGMLEGGEKVLVFSQYVECLDILRLIIAAELGEECRVYSGRMGQRARASAVDAFQNESGRRIMLVSLKAGGLGLNLTAASRIVHYDLWFNPAVENQATDRAFRIGQTKNVFVHRLITAGTFEEKLNHMLKSKRELADMSVATGESWISRLGDKELRELFE
jgi:superfamily II DNA or RNA helicase